MTAYELRISDWSSDVCSSDLIDGKVKGKVLTSGEKASSLSVSENGAIEGDVRVPHIVLNGTVIGDVHALEKITLAAKARVTGNVYYKIIEMEGGAQVNGQLVHETNRSEEHTSELPSLMRISYAVFCLKKKTTHKEDYKTIQCNH